MIKNYDFQASPLLKANNHVVILRYIKNIAPNAQNLFKERDDKTSKYNHLFLHMNSKNNTRNERRNIIMLIYTKGRELLEKDLIEQEKAQAGENIRENAHKIKTTKSKRQNKKFRRFFRKINK
ncbi:hypothetical protein [Salicibibacter halophilus]|uniref:hypothetical protein n=1 Tax=Salicibibacter halophilus TaxID=2502791 RepID=UPI00135BAEC4|nr:hypothetical protein [Salicibibacter halophilus]